MRKVLGTILCLIHVYFLACLEYALISSIDLQIMN